MAQPSLGALGLGFSIPPTPHIFPFHRRNTSVDENYEWDSEFPGDMELLETLHLGLAGSRPQPEAEPLLGE